MKRNIFGAFLMVIVVCGCGGGGDGGTGGSGSKFTGYQVWANNIPTSDYESTKYTGPWTGDVKNKMVTEHWQFLGSGTGTKTFYPAGVYGNFLVAWETTGTKFDAFDDPSSGTSLVWYYINETNLQMPVNFNAITGLPDGIYVTALEEQGGGYIVFKYSSTGVRPQQLRVTVVP